MSSGAERRRYSPCDRVPRLRSRPSAGTVLRRNLFVDPSELGLDHGRTDGTTVDTEC